MPRCSLEFPLSLRSSSTGKSNSERKNNRFFRTSATLVGWKKLAIFALGFIGPASMTPMFPTMSFKFSVSKTVMGQGSTMSWGGTVHAPEQERKQKCHEKEVA